MIPVATHLVRQQALLCFPEIVEGHRERCIVSAVLAGIVDLDGIRLFIRGGQHRLRATGTEDVLSFGHPHWHKAFGGLP